MACGGKKKGKGPTKKQEYLKSKKPFRGLKGKAHPRLA